MYVSIIYLFYNENQYTFEINKKIQFHAVAREREKKREKSKDKHWANDNRFNANKDCFMTFDTHNFNLFRMI